MWTTYSPHIYRREGLSIDKDSKAKEIPLEEVLPDEWVVLEGEDEEVPF